MQDCVTLANFEELKGELNAKPLMSEIKKLIRDEIAHSLCTMETRLADKKSPLTKTPHAGRATRLMYPVIEAHELLIKCCDVVV